jgi:hypothetical protein
MAKPSRKLRARLNVRNPNPAVRPIEPICEVPDNPPVSPASLSLDERVAALVEEVGAEIRLELRAALRALRDGGNVPATVMGVSRLMEGERGLLGSIAKASGNPLRGHNLEGQIDALAQKGALPAEIASDLHWIRIRANRARHNSERALLTVDDAETALSRALRVVEWFACESDRGPRLKSAYTVGASPPATLAARLAAFERRLLDLVAELQQRGQWHQHLCQAVKQLLQRQLPQHRPRSRRGRLADGAC